MSNPGVWKTWGGRVVDGKYTLRQWLGGSDHSAVFLTELPGQPSKAAIKLVANEGGDGDRQLARWRAAAQLSHPNLIRIFDGGRCQLDNTPLLYFLMEFAEEDLSQILPHRPLVPGEATDMLPPLLDALKYVHGKGFVHGRIKPSNVLAVGNQLKLSADQLAPSTELSSVRRRRDAYDAPETAAGIVSPAGDVWSIGVTLVAALTQTVSFAEEGSPKDPDPPGSVPEPFRGIARECLHLDPKRRCAISEIQARLHSVGRSVPATVSTVSPPSATGKRRSLAVGALAIALLAALIFFFSRGKTGTNAKTPEVPTSSAPAVGPPPKPKAATSDTNIPRKRSSGSQGGVVHQVIPDVSRNSRNTIRGTIKVTVRAEVDASGKVTSAKLKTPGPSRYFAGLALKSAERWEFSPAQAEEQTAATTWLIQFRFRRGGTEASAERVSR